AAADLVPILTSNDAIIVVALDGYGGVVLLRAVNVVGPAVVGDHVVELRCGLVVFRAPGLAVIGGDGSAAIVAVNHALRIVGINPQAVMIAMRRGKQVESPAAIGRAEHPGVEQIDRIR